jgi:hypothetical protein
MRCAASATPRTPAPPTAGALARLPPRRGHRRDRRRRSRGAEDAARHAVEQLATPAFPGPHRRRHRRRGLRRRQPRSRRRRGLARRTRRADRLAAANAGLTDTQAAQAAVAARIDALARQIDAARPDF